MIGNQIAGLLDSPFVPPAIPVSGYSLWLDGNDASSFSYSSGVVVSQWNDKSGNSRNFAQPTVANQPLRNATQNGKTGLTFQADWLYNTGFNWSNSAFTVFVVIKYDLAAANFSGVFGANAVTAPSLGVNSDDAFATFKVANSSYTYNLFPTGNTTADVAVWKSAGNSGSMTTAFYKNGTAASSTQTMTSLSTGTGAVLAASLDSGIDTAPASDPYEFIYEVIVYPSQLSDTNRNLVEGYLKTKWGTP